MNVAKAINAIEKRRRVSISNIVRKNRLCNQTDDVETAGNDYDEKESETLNYSLLATILWLLMTK